MAFNLFRKKTENELRCEFLKQEEHAESQLTLAYMELLKEWSTLESNYSVGLQLIQQRMDDIPQRFE